MWLHSQPFTSAAAISCVSEEDFSAKKACHVSLIRSRGINADASLQWIKEWTGYRLHWEKSYMKFALQFIMKIYENIVSPKEFILSEINGGFSIMYILDCLIKVSDCCLQWTKGTSSAWWWLGTTISVHCTGRAPCWNEDAALSRYTHLVAIWKLWSWPPSLFTLQPFLHTFRAWSWCF